jgi:membrane protein DedA with SNARE-associated domain
MFAWAVALPLQLAEMPPYLESLLASRYAYVALLGVFVLEGAMLMYFMPSELMVPGALVLVGSSPGDVAAIIGVSVLGATVGQYALFKLAKRGGREYLLQKRWFRVSESRLERFDGWFQRWGPVVVPVSNTLLFTRGMLTVPAGLAELDDRRFVVLSAVGTLSFETILAGLYLYFDTLL